ncbi:MAG: hypothetical protein J6K85_01925 [Clostridia bacterium]|nr:hypothetical protein [Clostridia bacterium]
MRRALGFIPLVFYALVFLLFGGLSLLSILGTYNADDLGVAISGAYLFIIIGPVAILAAVLLLFKILHVTTRFSLFGILCSAVDLFFVVNAIRLFISYMTDSIPFGTHEITLIVLAVVSALSFITNVYSIKA